MLINLLWFRRIRLLIHPMSWGQQNELLKWLFKVLIQKTALQILSLLDLEMFSVQEAQSFPYLKNKLKQAALLQSLIRT